MEATIELLDQVIKLENWIREELKINVVVKPHPMMSKEKILNKVNFPKQWVRDEVEINLCLNKSFFFIVSKFASITDAILGGCITISLNRTLNTSWNYLDSLVEEFPILNAIDNLHLKTKLESIYTYETEKYILVFREIRTRIINGINPRNDYFLSKFIV